MCDCPELGALIAYCGHLGKQSMDQLLRRAGYDVTPAQTHLLMRLTCTGEGQEATQRDLEKQLRLVSLTEAGWGKVEDFRGVVEKAERLYAAGLSGQEREQLERLLNQIITNLENEVNSV